MIIIEKKFSIIVLVVLAIIISIVSSVFTVANASIDTSKTGSITLTAYEFINGEENNKKVLTGAEFAIYKVSDEVQNIEDAETYIASYEAIQTLKTDEQGTVCFSDLKIGRYYVKEIDAPTNVLTKMEPFLVDIPTTNSNGTDFEYDIVASPKNVTVYGNVTLKITTDGTTLEGAEFKLQKYEDDKWVDFDFTGNVENEAINNTTNSIVTDENGKIEVKNLGVGKYRFVETTAPNGYIADGLDTQEFEISLNNTEVVINMTNEKPELYKYVLSNNNKELKSMGVDIKDIIKWKITATVPSIINKMNTFKIHDNASNSLDILEDTIKIYGINENIATLLENNSDYELNIENNLITINFKTQNLVNFTNIEIEYQTRLNNNIEYGQAIYNESYISYTNTINQDGREGSISKESSNGNSTAEVHTGKLLVLKTDGKIALQGAKFKIATSEENAKAGLFVTDENGEDIVATSDSNGYVIFYGLKYGKDDDWAEFGSSNYWLVEVQAPSYTDDEGQTKYYNLLSNPVKVQVDATSGDISENTTEIINKKGFILPNTGAIGIGVCALIGVGIAVVAIIIGKKKDEEKA